jgi:tetratricopeptide (TPR) repeat protein
VDQVPNTKLPADGMADMVAGESGEPTAKDANALPVAPLFSIDGKTAAGFVASVDAAAKFVDVPTPAILPLRTPVPAAIETAEGYLELVTLPAVRLGVNSKTRREFAKKAHKLASQCGDCAHEPKHESRRQMVIGQSQRLLRRYPAAISAFRKASSHRPTRVEALMAMGWCQKRIGRTDLAVTSLTRALSIVPEDARLHYNLACYLACQGECRAALYELAWALQLEPRLNRRASGESDFDVLRTSPAFSALTSSRVMAK